MNTDIYQKLILELNTHFQDNNNNTQSRCLKLACKNFLKYCKDTSDIQSIYELSINHLKKMTKMDDIDTILAMTTYFSDSRRNVLDIKFHYYSPYQSDFNYPEILTATEVEDAIKNKYFIDPISGYDEPNFKQNIVIFFVLTDYFKKEISNG